MLSNVRLTSEEKMYNQKTVADARLTMQVGHRARNEGLYFPARLIFAKATGGPSSELSNFMTLRFFTPNLSESDIPVRIKVLHVKTCINNRSGTNI